MDVTRNWNWVDEMTGSRQGDGKLNVMFEDKWFWDRLAGFPREGDGTLKAILPDIAVSRSFAVGDLWGGHPLGYDGALVKHESKKWEILEWCPEYGMTMLTAVLGDLNERQSENW